MCVLLLGAQHVSVHFGRVACWDRCLAASSNSHLLHSDHSASIDVGPGGGGGDISTIQCIYSGMVQPGGIKQMFCVLESHQWLMIQKTMRNCCRKEVTQDTGCVHVCVWGGG
jgi:hypothetical protein